MRYRPFSAAALLGAALLAPLLSPAAAIGTLAGTGSGGFNADGISATSATIDYPIGVADRS